MRPMGSLRRASMRASEARAERGRTAAAPAASAAWRNVRRPGRGMRANRYPGGDVRVERRGVRVLDRMPTAADAAVPGAFPPTRASLVRAAASAEPGLRRQAFGALAE